MTYYIKLQHIVTKLCAAKSIASGSCTYINTRRKYACVIIDKYVTRIIFTLTLILSIPGCGTLPEEEDYTIPLQHFGEQQQANIRSADYILRPEDVLDVLYHFDTTSNEKYKIAPHDKLNVMFLNASEYDNVHQVRPDGYISLPFIGDVKVADKSVEEAKENITKLYESVFVDPSFFISLTEYQVRLKEVIASLGRGHTGGARLITVREDHKITLPLIGDLSVKEKSIAQLKTDANLLYNNTIKGLSVDILLQKSHPKQIYVFGEVNNPGGHTISQSVSLFKAIAIAGGANHDAELTTVVALTQENNEMVAKVFDLEAALNGGEEAFSAMLSPEDVIYVPRTRLSTTAQVMRSISEILLYRGMGVTFAYRLDDDDDT